MFNDRAASSVMPIAVTLTVLFGIYVGAYRWMVYPVAYSGDPVPVYTFQEKANSRWRAFFSPIHWFDRRIRPHIWEPIKPR